MKKQRKQPPFYILYNGVYIIYRGGFSFFFSKVLERKKYSYIHIYTRNKKKKKKNNLFRLGTEADFFTFAGTGLYFDTSSERGARPANEGLCSRNITCARTRYALTPAAADFVRFAGLLCAGWYKLPGGERKRAKREILRKIWKCANFVVSLQPKIKT